MLVGSIGARQASINAIYTAVIWKTFNLILYRG